VLKKGTAVQKGKTALRGDVVNAVRRLSPVLTEDVPFLRPLGPPRTPGKVRIRERSKPLAQRPSERYGRHARALLAGLQAPAMDGTRTGGSRGPSAACP
jgi:hypothetical protein